MQNGTWQDFVARCHACQACGLASTRTNVVVWRGSVPAPLLFIGEGPGRDEDLLGKPFVGRSGQLLELLLTAFGLDEGLYHIANTVKCRPPGNRNPLDEEIAACRALLDEQMKMVEPKVIVLLGGVAYRQFTGDKTPISKMRGRFFESEGRFVMPTFHPAYVLRNNKERNKLWADIGMARRKLETLGALEPLRFVPEMPTQYPRKTDLQGTV